MPLPGAKGPAEADAERVRGACESKLDAPPPCVKECGPRVGEPARDEVADEGWVTGSGRWALMTK